MSGDPVRGPYPLQHSLGDKSILFRTMLKQAADMLTQEDVESLAYIHSVQKAVTALNLFRELEAKGVFSADDVEPLEELLRGINRHDVANTVVKEFKAKLKGVRRSGSDSQLSQRFVWQNKKTNISMDSDTSSSHHLTLTPHTLPPHTPPSHTTSILHSEVAGQQQSLPSLCPSESLNLAGMSIAEKRGLLQSLVADQDLQGELPSLVNTTLQASINPLQTLQGDLPLSPASPPESRALTSQAGGQGDMQASSSCRSFSSSPEAISPTPSVSNGPISRERSGGSLSSEASRRTSTSGFVSSPECSLTCLRRQTSSSSNGSMKEYVDVTAVRPVHSRPMQKLTSHCRGRTVTTWNGHRRMEWSVVRNDLAQRIVCHSNTAFVKGSFSLTADGIKSRIRKPVSLVFKLYPYGIGKDENQFLTLEVIVECRSPDLRTLGMLNLTTTVSIDQGREFISSKTHRHTLRSFTIHDFLPHEVVTRSHSSTVDFAVEAHITFDVDSPPHPQGLVELPEDSSQR